MAQEETHIQKATLFWQLAEQRYATNATPFLCINLAMYSIGHWVEALLAQRGRHPATQPKGVPHGDRGALLKSVLVSEGIVSEEWAHRYSDLVGCRDTFIENSIPPRSAATEFMNMATPLIAYLSSQAFIYKGEKYGNC